MNSISANLSEKTRAYVSEDGYYIIPVSWTYAGAFRVKADNLGAAIDAVEEHLDALPLPSDPIYINDSFRIDIDDDESAMVAQDYISNSDIDDWSDYE